MTDQLPFTSPEFKEVWDEWLQYRKERKEKKYVPIGLKKTLTRLVNDSGNNEATAIKMIQNAMEMSWRGIYPINQNNGTYNGTVTKSTNSKSAGANALLSMLEDRLRAG